MGIKPLDLSQWIEIDELFKEHLLYKKMLVDKHYKTVIRQLPTSAAAVLETEKELTNHLVKMFPNVFSLEGKTFFVKPTLQTFTMDDDPIEALKRIAQYTQEDFCLLSDSSPVILEAGTVCFPSRWKIEDKIGKDTFGIHAPVPKFKETIGKPTASFLEMLPKDKPVWRMNWTLHDNCDLFCPEAQESHKDLNINNVLDETYIRVERQTLRRLPISNYILFSIRTYIYPVSLAILDPKRKDLLRRTLDGLPEDTAFYKGMRRFFPIIKSALS